MDDGAPTDYVKLAPLRHPPRRVAGDGAEGRHWRRFREVAATRLVGAVTHLHYCPAAPHDLAATASTRVHLFAGRTRAPRGAISRFPDVAHGAVFRADGAALAAGCADGAVRLFDARTRGLLRVLPGHAAPARAVAFGPPADRLALASGGDDATLRLWDAAAGAQSGRLDGHADYVRALAPGGPGGAAGGWLSGSYDHTVKLWDARAGQCIATFDHGAPVEAVVWLPGAGLFASAGGPTVKVWDGLARRATPLASLTPHSKTVTCLAAAATAGPKSAAGARLLTGGLDGAVKVVDLDTFRVSATWRAGAPVAALALAPDGATLAVGCGDGSLTLRRSAAKPRPAGAPPGAAPGHRLRAHRRAPRYANAAHFRYFLRGKDARPGPQDTVLGPDPRRKRPAAHPSAVDAALRAFRHGAALDAAIATGRAAVVGAALDELAARGALAAAVGGRDAGGVAPLVSYVRRAAPDPRHGRRAAALAHALLDAYAPAVGRDAGVDAALAGLADALRGAARGAAALARVAGAAEALRALAVA